MTAEEALERLSQALSNNPSITIVLGAEPDSTAGILLQRLTIQQDLAEEFLTTASEAVPEANSEVTLRPYDPGYKPEPNEICYIELAGQQQIAEVVHQVSQVQQAELFHEDDNIVDSLRFYAIVASPSARKRSIFFRTYSPTRELTRRKGFAALFQRGSYNRVKHKIFLFDYQIDCFAWDGYLFIRNVPAFQRIFKYFEELRAHANQTVDIVSARIPISNVDEFRAAVTGQIQMIAKLAQISRKPYLATVTMADIRRTINEFHLDVTIAENDGQDQLIFEPQPKKRWLILKLLDDDYLGSVMTHEKYEVNSKSRIS
jgi:hypothetical protein